MSHKKFEKPRAGSLGFLPRKRCQRGYGKVKAFPVDKQDEKPHFTAFMGYKAGSTHVVRGRERKGCRTDGRDVVEAATVIETPPMTVVGVVGYVDTPRGLRTLTTVFAEHLSESVLRRFYKNFYAATKGENGEKKAPKAFSKYAKSFKAASNTELERIKKYATAVRALMHTQPEKIGMPLKKAHLMEVQINGGNVADKVDFVTKLFEQEVRVANIFTEGECVDTIGITKGRGTQGVISRWGVTRLPRKTHRGLRKVACVGAWHPAQLEWTVARAGQQGFHHRTEVNKRVLRVGAAGDKNSASTEHDLTEKSITPMGGFPHYGVVNNDFLLLKGCCVGTKKRVITLRKSLHPLTKRVFSEPLNLKFIDTASKTGRGRFQTVEERNKFFGIVKK